MQRLIHEIRECLNVSQDDMAKMIGTSYATVNRWENGHSRPGKTPDDKGRRYTWI